VRIPRGIKWRNTYSDKGEHHITVPRHKTLRVGTLNNILADIASHLEKEKDALMKELFE
jgi:hypothetical protein